MLRRTPVGRLMLPQCCLALLVLIGAPVVPAHCEAAPTNADDSEAAPLVQRALDGELSGDPSRRRELLAAAIRVDPDYAPARWLSGQVQFAGQWRSVDNVASMVTADSRWAEYRQRRDAVDAIDAGAQEHAYLAQWCQREGLADEERYHWANALLADPGHKLALKNLKLRPYRDGLHTPTQIAANEAQLTQEKEDLKRHKLRITRLCREAVRQGPQKEPLAEIAAIDDPSTMQALKFGVEAASDRATPEACRDLHLAFVTALGNMPQHEATLRLLELAVDSPLAEVRAAAAAELKERPATDYVPLLMAALTATVEVDFDIYTAPDGTVRLTQTTYQTGPESDRAHTSVVNFERADDADGIDEPEQSGRILRDHLARASQAAAEAQQLVDRANELAAVRNERIETVLAAASGLAPDADPEAWWQAWQEHNELYYPEGKSLAQTYDEQTFVYAPPSISECFAAGTPVWTQGGPKPIEEIATGDIVLAQDPSTGEISYRPVMQTSVRDAKRVIDLVCDGETISTTPGHRFWVNRRGWEMARFLSATQQLHALAGNVEIASIAEGRPNECYNLVVDDFHTFFVGKQRLLVHDMTCPRPTVAAVPGSNAVRSPTFDSRTFAAPPSPFE